MSASTAPHGSSLHTGRDGFAQLLRAEWDKFRTVPAWVVGAAVATLVIVLLSLFAASGSHVGMVVNGKSVVGGPSIPVGPGGVGVADSFYFVHRPLAGDGQHHGARHLAHGRDSGERERPCGREPPRHRAPRTPALGQGRAHRQTEHRARFCVRRRDGHRRARRAAAVRLHPRRGRPHGYRLSRVPALAAADSLRRLHHRLRVGRRHALDYVSARLAWPAWNRPSRSGCSSPPRCPVGVRAAPPAWPPPSSTASSSRAAGLAASGTATVSEAAPASDYPILEHRRVPRVCRQVHRQRLGRHRPGRQRGPVRRFDHRARP